MNQAAVRFCEEVTKKASAEGWTLSISPIHYIWKKGDVQFGSQPSMRMRTNNPPLQERLHEACFDLEAREKWTLEVVL